MFHEQEPGSAEARLRFNKLLPKQLKFKILFDSTGSLGVETLNIGGIQPELDKFLKIAYEINDEKLSPNILEIHWGTLIYPCRLSAISINYSKFDFRGNPCRGTADCTFTGDLSIEGTSKKKKSQTAGTKVKDITVGDALDAIATGVSATAGAYLVIAKANKLKSLRGPIGLPPATKLIIPPDLG